MTNALVSLRFLDEMVISKKNLSPELAPNSGQPESVENDLALNLQPNSFKKLDQNNF